MLLDFFKDFVFVLFNQKQQQQQQEQKWNG